MIIPFPALPPHLKLATRPGGMCGCLNVPQRRAQIRHCFVALDHHFTLPRENSFGASLAQSLRDWWMRASSALRPLWPVALLPSPSWGPAQWAHSSARPALAAWRRRRTLALSIRVRDQVCGPLRIDLRFHLCGFDFHHLRLRRWLRLV